MKKINKCRICGNHDLVEVLNLGIQSLTGVFLKNKMHSVTKGPLILVKCSGENFCGLVQLQHSYDPNEMYGGDYGYRSGLNKSMVDHLHKKIDSISARYELSEGDLIIDIGSNDGTSLNRYKHGYDLVGFDPTAKKFKKYYKKSITIVDDFFSNAKLNEIRGARKAKVITSFSMFYDLESPQEFVNEIEQCLEKDGIWEFEQSYLPIMLKRNSYDTVCHEHLEYYGLKQIQYLLKKANLKIINIETNDVNGGSISITAAKKISKYHVCEEIIREYTKGECYLDYPETWENFRKSVISSKNELREFLINCKKINKKVLGLGASTKGNVILQYCEINEDLICAIGEVNPEKYGRYTPGTGIEIINESEIYEKNPDYIVILPWHFKDFFLNHKSLKKFNLVFPLPKLEIRLGI